MRKIIENYFELAEEASIKYNLETSLIYAVIAQESSGDPLATRAEDGFYRKYLKNKTAKELAGWVPMRAHTNAEVLMFEKVFRSISYGLMQIMGDTARWFGKVEGKLFDQLSVPKTNIDLGCRYLRYFIDKGGSIEYALKRYNGSYKYVGEVLDKKRKFEEYEYEDIKLN